MIIKRLHQEHYENIELVFQYTTEFFYDVVLNESDFFNVTLVRKAFPSAVFKEFRSNLFADHVFNPRVFGLYAADELCGYLEVGDERHNRLRIHNLLIEMPFRGRGYGRALLKFAQELCVAESFRELVLETQSCNDPAIHAYRSSGFKVMGLDLTHYSLQDIANKEVRLEMMWAPKIASKD